MSCRAPRCITAAHGLGRLLAPHTLNALGRVDGIDLRGCSDGDLWLRRGTYERETAWAPPHVAGELRLMRLAERDAHVNAVRADHEARAARADHAASRHRQLAQVWRALEAKAARETDELAATPLPSTENDGLSPGLAWPTAARRARDAVLQPPQSDVVPSARVLQQHQAVQANVGPPEPERD